MIRPRLTIFDSSPHICGAFSDAFHDYPDVHILNRYLEDVIDEPFDCIVCPGNSFGMLDGRGIDTALASFIDGLQGAIRERIKMLYYGEQPVGTSLLVNTDSSQIPLVAYTPIMRFPRQLQDEVVYDATRAFLMEIEKFNAELDNDYLAIRNIASAPIGTGSGGISFTTSAYLSSLAYDSIYEHGQKAYLRWDEDIAEQIRRIYLTNLA